MEVSATNYHFAGWATCCNKLCSDGRTIMPDAFKHQDGAIVPLVWNHQHNDPNNILGKALVHSRDGGMYAYCLFNDTESGNTAKELVSHGDICALSIFATNLKHNNNRGVMHGVIREVSLVLAGANPGAFIDSVIKHGEECEEEATIYHGEEDLVLYHAEETKKEESKPVAEETKKVEEEKKPEEKTDDGKTLGDVFETLTDEQKTAVYIIVDEAVKNATSGDTAKHSEENETENDEGGNTTMKHNVFDQNDQSSKATISHADKETIINLAKTSSVGSLQEAISLYVQENEETLAHGIDEIETLFPEFHDTNTGTPETIKRDLGWVTKVINGVHKSPYTRIRTRQADARIAELRAKGYQKKGDKKELSGNIKLISRTTDPQTIYRKDELNRDDIIDITDFDVVNYIWSIMRDNMQEDIALSIMVGDGRDDGDPDKIHETHVRSIWNDEELYTIHRDVDIEGAKKELQGTNTGANFSDNYVMAEAVVRDALYAREEYKGSGTLDLYCSPHLLNVMLLSRDLNGRRIYSSKADLAAALNVGNIYTVEQFEGRTRTTTDGKTKKLLGLFVNLSNYQLGCAKGGEITKFDDFDIDFNKYKYLMETRISGAPIRIKSAIALEEDVTEDAEG